MAFCKEYNAATQDKIGTVIPVEITVFEVSLIGRASCCTHLCAMLLFLSPTRVLFPSVSAQYSMGTTSAQHLGWVRLSLLV